MKADEDLLRRAEKALEASRLIYTIVRPGGMERPQDDYKVTHNVALSPRDTLFGGQVSRLPGCRANCHGLRRNRPGREQGETPLLPHILGMNRDTSALPVVR